MRYFALALVLACVLSGTVSAGEIPTTGATAPQPPSSVVTTGKIHSSGASAAGEIPSTGAVAPQESTTLLTVLLTLLSIVR